MLCQQATVHSDQRTKKYVRNTGCRQRIVPYITGVTGVTGVKMASMALPKDGPHKAIPMGRVPVQRPFETISVDFVKCKVSYVSAAGEKMQRRPDNDRVPTTNMLCDPHTNTKQVCSRNPHAIIDRILDIFGPPEILHSDQSPEFKHGVSHQPHRAYSYSREPAQNRQGKSVFKHACEQRTHCSACAARSITSTQGHRSYREYNWPY